MSYEKEKQKKRLLCSHTEIKAQRNLYYRDIITAQAGVNTHCYTQGETVFQVPTAQHILFL